MKNIEISEILEIFYNNHKDLYSAMKNTEHGYLGIDLNPYHLEGDVWTHTMMVLKQTEKESIIIKLAALCHDLGKPFVFEDNHKSKRRRFSSHEAVSTFYTKEVLESFKEICELTKEDIDLIIFLVSNHGALYNFFEDGRLPRKHFSKLSKRFKSQQFRLLIKLYKADHNGRFYNNLSKNDTGIYEDFNNILEYMEILEFDEEPVKSKNTITIMIGLPRSGKSSIVSNMSGAIISRDEFVEEVGKGSNYSEKWKSLTDDMQKDIDKRVLEKYNHAILSNQDIIIDMTNMSKKSRRKWLSDNRLKTYKKVAYLVLESKSICLSRNNLEKNIPEFVLDNMMKSFVYPDYEEFDEIIIN